MHGSSSIPEEFQDFVLFTRKGDPISRIEIYPSGANRVVSPGFSGHNCIPPLRDKNDISSFSTSARRRYFRYCNSLDLSGFFVYLLNCTIQSFLLSFLNVKVYRRILKVFFKKIIRMKFDYVYKNEYTAQGVPHLHMFIYSKSRLFRSEEERLEKADFFSKMWTDIVFCNLDFGKFNNIFNAPLLSQIRANMYVHSCEYLAKPRSLAKSIAYYSFYTSKNKDYQNLIPKNFLGIKCWGYGKENYKDIRKDIINLPLSPRCYSIVRDVVDTILRGYGKSLHKLNGFYIPPDFLNQVLKSVATRGYTPLHPAFKTEEEKWEFFNGHKTFDYPWMHKIVEDIKKIDINEFLRYFRYQKGEIFYDRQIIWRDRFAKSLFGRNFRPCSKNQG